MALYTRRSTRKSLIDTVAFRGLSQAASALSYVVVVRAMSKEDFGVLNLLYAFYPLVGTVASLGLEQALRRYQPEFLNAGRPEAAHWLWRTVARTRFGVNVAVLLLVLFSWNFAAPVFKLTPYRAEFALFCIPMLLHFQVRILRLSLASHMLQRHSLGALAWLAIVKLVAYLVIDRVGTLTLDMAILVDTVGYGVAYGLLVWAYRTKCLPSVPDGDYSPSREEKKRLLRYAGFNNFNDAGSYVVSARSDTFFIAAILNPVAVGIYAFYVRLNLMVVRLLPTRFFDNVLQPLVFAVPVNEAAARIPRYFSLLLNMNLLLQWPVLAFTCAYHRELVLTVFGSNFADHSWMLPLVVGLTSLDVAATPVTYVAQYHEKAATLLLSKLFGIYSIIALLILVPIWGVAGAAIATGSAQVFKDGFVWWRVRKSARWLNAASALVAGLLVWGSAIAICLAVKRFFHVADVIHLLLGVTIIGTAWLAFVRSPALSEADRQLLASVMRGREAAMLRLIGLIGKPARRSPAGEP